MVVRGNAGGGGGVFISVLQGDHRKLTTEEGDHYRAQSGGGDHMVFRGNAGDYSFLFYRGTIGN